MIHNGQYDGTEEKRKRGTTLDDFGTGIRGAQTSAVDWFHIHFLTAILLLNMNGDSQMFLSKSLTEREREFTSLGWHRVYNPSFNKISTPIHLSSRHTKISLKEAF